jgi:hypothetical protein
MPMGAWELLQIKVAKLPMQALKEIPHGEGK